MLKYVSAFIGVVSAAIFLGTVVPAFAQIGTSGADVSAPNGPSSNSPGGMAAPGASRASGTSGLTNPDPPQGLNSGVAGNTNPNPALPGSSGNPGTIASPGAPQAGSTTAP